jgi:hypothetical protein
MIKLFDGKVISGALAGAFITVVIAAIGYFVTDYFKFLDENRKIISTQYEEIKLAEQNVLDDIRKFADQANGDHTVTASDRESLRKSLQVLYQKEEYLAKHISKSDNEFKELGLSMIDLEKSAMEITGPTNAKPFVEATGRFLKAKNEFDQKALNLQRSYWASSL